MTSYRRKRRKRKLPPDVLPDDLLKIVIDFTRQIRRGKVRRVRAGTKQGNIVIVGKLVGLITFDRERDLFGVVYLVKKGGRR